VFGSTIKLLQGEFGKFGVETSFVSQTDVARVAAAMRPNTKLLFAETPTNPLTEVCDIQALADIAHEAGALLAVDNCLCSPALQQPVKFGADIVMHSGTKFLDGQGRVDRRRAVRQRGAGARPVRAGDAQRRHEPVAVQRLGRGQGPGDAVGARAGAERARTPAGALARGAPGRGPRLLTPAWLRTRSTRWRCASRTATAAPCCPST
jgi:hypothetical protein